MWKIFSILWTKCLHWCQLPLAVILRIRMRSRTVRQSNVCRVGYPEPRAGHRSIRPEDDSDDVPHRLEDGGYRAPAVRVRCVQQHVHNLK